MSGPVPPPEPSTHAALPASKTVAVYHPDEGGPLELLLCADHPLVKAMMVSNGKWRRRLSVTTCAAALLASGLAGAAFLFDEPGVERVASTCSGLFICLWPLAMLLGGALRTASRVIAERSEGTAPQLVLTPLEKRPIIAGLVLPHAAPYLAGIVAALPLYVWTGASLTGYGFLSMPWAFWPFRFSVLANVQYGVTPSGAITGLVMCVTDLALIWAALHWGAAYAVRLAGFTATMPFVLWRLALTVLISGIWYALVATGGAVLSLVVNFVESPLFGVALALSFGWLHVEFWRRFLLPRTVGLTLAEFGHFDRLADEEFVIKPARWFSWLSPFRDYGERP